MSLIGGPGPSQVRQKVTSVTAKLMRGNSVRSFFDIAALRSRMRGIAI